ncbi:uncharacterized protein LOC111900098 [Lactuca sativa]|uniref:uncharacterized protein LOC111900098 n=1 Tax=Lactuca sativa TaxID=4236 RepID=UPI000CD8D7B8|nr:uncharacterized protein LOC111900098 [Lactuca sativa]
MGESPDTMEDDMRMSERTARESLFRLSKGVETFIDVYLQKPSLHDTQELYAAHEEETWRLLLSKIHQSPIFHDLLNGKAPDAPFTVNGNKYKFGYYLTDVIYPLYSTFVKTFRHPVEEREKLFKRRQDRARKNVERAFGVLKAK